MRVPGVRPKADRTAAGSTILPDPQRSPWSRWDTLKTYPHVLQSARYSRRTPGSESFSQASTDLNAWEMVIRLGWCGSFERENANEIPLHELQAGRNSRRESGGPQRVGCTVSVVARARLGPSRACLRGGPRVKRSVS